MTQSEIDRLARAVAREIQKVDLITQEELMRRLDISSKDTVAKMRAAGLESYKLDAMRRRYYRWSEVVDFITNNAV